MPLVLALLLAAPALATPELSEPQLLLRGEAVTVTVWSRPGMTVALVGSRLPPSGPGWCPGPNQRVCTDLSAPASVLGVGRADANGVASFVVRAPRNVTTAWVQAMETDGLVVGRSQVLEVPVLPPGGDFDGDGLTNRDELVRGTPWYDPDPDADRLADGEEIAIGTDPFNPDTDYDGLGDGDEVALGADPHNWDTDGDFLMDFEEVMRGTDPSRDDTDGDGLDDGYELEGLWWGPTDPLDPDTDGGGVSDGEEALVQFSNPNDRNDDLTPWIIDDDDDGLSRAGEEAAGTDNHNPDTDADGWLDGDEVVSGSDPLDPLSVP